MSYPLKPAHLIQVNLRLNEFKSKVLLVQVAQDNGSWFEVISCPVSEVLQTMRAAAIRERAEAARAETLLSSMRDPLRSELTTLLKQGKKVSAITRYREVSGEDLSVAKRVIELLEK
jgi:ribosomal protein L7/L12